MTHTVTHTDRRWVRRWAARPASRWAARPTSRRARLPARPWAALPLLLVALLVGTVFDGEAAGPAERPERVLVVVDASAGHDAALESRAASALRAAERRGAVEGQLRVPRSPTEQLSVTHYFAAQGYDRVIGVGLDRRVAVGPVAARYPDVRFQLVGEHGLAAALSTG